MNTGAGRLRSTLVALAVRASLAAGAPAEAEDADIVGLRLGMTVAEVKAALSAYDPAITIDEQWQYYSYGDGVNVLRTEDFLAYINAHQQVISGDHWGSEGFSVFFSSPPEEARAVAVTRTLDNTPHPLTSQQFREALVAKYGAPASESSHEMRWLFPEGKVDCVLNSGSYHPTHDDFLRHVFQGGVAGRMNNPQAKDLSDCAAYLVYRVGTGTFPASSVSALMIDVAAKATSELAANEWVNGLAEAARKTRESGAEAPKL